MMQKSWIPLLLALLLAGCNQAADNMPETPGIYGSWSEAYEDFVCGEKFLTADFPGQAEDVWWDQPLWGTDSPPEISLRDLDLDGIPELIVSNGRGAALERAAYVYTFADGRIEYIGVCIPDISYVPDSPYSGVFCRFYAGSGTGSVSYCTKDGHTIRAEMVCSYEWASDGGREEQVTGDDILYDSAKNSTVPLYSAAAEQIADMGWDAFVQESDK